MSFTPDPPLAPRIDFGDQYPGAATQANAAQHDAFQVGFGILGWVPDVVRVDGWLAELGLNPNWTKEAPLV